MTSGGLSMTEGWNLQLQGRVRDLEADLAEAEDRLKALTDDMRSSAQWTLARGFIQKMHDKRLRAIEQAAEIDALLAIDSNAGQGPPRAEGATSDLELRITGLESLLCDSEARVRELEEALREVMDWIGNWDPDFTQDADWPSTRDRARRALSTKGKNDG